MSTEHSRSLRLAAGVSASDELTLRERQETALVLVRVDPDLPFAQVTARTLLTTLRRLPGRLVLLRGQLPADAVDDLVQAVEAVDSSRPLTVAEEPPSDTDVRLDISLSGEHDSIRLVPDGYGAQLVNDATIDLVLWQPANALGAVFAAALGAAETFKRIVVDKEGRRSFHPHLRFCPVTLSQSTSEAPELPDALPLDTAIIGNGAIGTAVALVLSELQLGGRVVVCDPERYGPENRGTYSLGGEHEAREQPPKVDVVGAVLSKAGYDVVKVHGKSTELVERVDRKELQAPRTAIAGLDTPEARRETQTLWPDHLIDAATGDTGVGLHHALPTGPCLRCFFPERQAGPDPLLQLARETGLPIGRLKRGDDALTQEDIAALSPEQREKLGRFIGRPVCGLADALGLTAAHADGYLPSVPFVSQMAACLAVGRLLAVELGLDVENNFFQFDALHGPVVEGDSRNAVATCYCQERQSIVRRVRQLRYGGREAA
jgi:hypothetical protein